MRPFASGGAKAVHILLRNASSPMFARGSYLHWSREARRNFAEKRTQETSAPGGRITLSAPASSLSTIFQIVVLFLFVFLMVFVSA